MNREAIEAQMDALMGTATLKKLPKTAAPMGHIKKSMMAALVVGGAILGVLLMEIFHCEPAPSSPVSDQVEAVVEDPQRKPKGRAVFIYLDLGRLHM